MKILVVRFSSIGDIVLTTPVVRCLALQVPGAEIHYITKRQFASLLTGNQHISKVITIEKSIDEVLPELKAANYDCVIDLHKNIRTLSLRRKLGVKSYAFPKLNFQKWLLVNFKSDKMPKRHVVDRYFEAVTPLGVENDRKNCELSLQPEHFTDLRELGVSKGSYVAVAVGAQFATKVMPPKLLANVIGKLQGPVILLGGPTDVENAATIIAALPEEKQGQVINAVNRYSILESAGIVARAGSLLSHDTGLMHIATCFDIPVISIWGNTVPALGMFPYYPDQPELYSIHEVNNLSCRPCSKIGYQSCPKKHFNCMTLQDTDAIAQDVLQRMGNK